MPLFKIEDKKAAQIKPTEFKSEKELQTFIENNLGEIFDIRFIETEFSTGEKHGGRIDTLGLDDANNPVIIEYKWGEEKNIINQGLFYLDWLVDHKGDFSVLAENKLGKKTKIEWGNPRLILLARSFNKFDKHAINTMADNIELWSYTLYTNNLFEVKSEDTSKQAAKNEIKRKSTKIAYDKFDLKYHLNKTTKEIQTKFNALREMVLQLPNVTEQAEQKSGITYRTTKSVMRFEFRKKCIDVLVRQAKYIDPGKIVEDITSFDWGYKGRIRLSATSNIRNVFEIVRQSYEETL